MRKPAHTLLLAMLAVFPLYGQNNAPPPPLVEKINVSIVSVDVTVTDNHGRPVTGLTKEDFEIEEDGKPQKVTNFYRIENAMAQTGRSEGAIVEAVDQRPFRRKVVLLIDNNFIEKPQRDAALQRLDDFIDNHFAGGYEWSVAVIGHEVQNIQPFTDSKEELHSALERARATPTISMPREIDRDLLSDPSRRGLSELAGNNYDFGETMRFKGREQTLRNLRSTINTGRAVIQTCRAYAASEGKKLLILITGGMESNTSFSAYDQTRDRNLHDSRVEIEKVLDLITREANSANFNIYVINARTRAMQAPQHDVVNRSSGGSMSTNLFQSGGGNEPIDVSDVDSTSLTLALRTGGLYMPSNDIAQTLERIDTNTSNFYSLGYSPQHFEDNGYHHIKVVVKRPGASVQNREGYVDLSADNRIESTLRSPITFAKEKGSLPVALQIGLPSHEGGFLTVPVVAATAISNLTIVPHEDKFVGRVHVYLSVYDRTGNNVGYHHQIQDVALTAQQWSNARQEAFRYHMNVRLRKGDFAIVVTLRDDVTNEIGSALQNVSF
jgi:VWFA-related protein